MVAREVGSDRTQFLRNRLIALTAVAVVAAALVTSSNAAASADSAGLDQRTRAIAYLVKKCGRAATLALRAATNRTDVRRPELVSLARAGCDVNERRLLKVPGGDLDFVPEDALAVLDDWRRGLSLLADYAASGKPATLARARKSLTSANAWSLRVFEEIDQTRLRHGFARL